MGNEYEQQARAVKAFKLARVAGRLLAEPGVTVSDLREVDGTFRHRVAELAGTHDPSPETWAVVIAMLEADE